MPRKKQNQIVPGKLPPQNLEAEVAAIGAVLLDKEALLSAVEVLSPEDFYDQRNETIFRAILTLFEKRTAIDMVTLTEQLEKEKELANVGGSTYIVSIVNATPSAANVAHYAKIVRDKAILRRLITSAVTISGLGFDEEEEVSAVLDKAEQSLFAVSQRFFRQKFIPLKDVLAEAFDRIDRIHKDKGALRGLSTGFRDLDSKLAGLQKSDIIIIAARPSMGKTSLALNIAEHIAVEDKVPVAFFSLEMSKEQMVDRLISSQAGVDSWKLRTGNLSDDDFPKIGYAMGTLSEAPFFIDDSPGLMVTEIRAKARRLQMEENLGIIFIDYLQLIEGHRTSGDVNRVQEISEISRSLKNLARELNIPVVAMSQLSRAVEHRPDKRPQLSDLRESGCLSGDSLVFEVSSGLRLPIKDIVGKKNLKVLAAAGNGRLISVSASKIFSTGRKKLFEITLASGKKIKATANHKFLTIDGWKRLDELSLENDKLATIDTTLDQHDLCGSDVIWDKIKEIKPLGIEEVFDITVPKEHNFVANDIIVHNSIEQDADVVAFIYREDYYNDKTDKKGVTEILIRKHRNGPIGNVELFFNAEQMRFRDLAKRPTTEPRTDFGPED